jgi:hypothetical protein
MTNKNKEIKKEMILSVDLWENMWVSFFDWTFIFTDSLKKVKAKNLILKLVDLFESYWIWVDKLDWIKIITCKSSRFFNCI